METYDPVSYTHLLSAPKTKRPLARPSCIGVTVLDYQAATTAPLNLVSMNCFTAGL